MTALANKVKVSATFQTSDPNTISVKLTQNSDGKIKFAQTGGGTADDVTVQLSKGSTSQEISVWGREASTGVDKKEVTATEVATGTTPARPGVSPATTKGTVLTGCDLQFEGEIYSPVDARVEIWRHSKDAHVVDLPGDPTLTDPVAVDDDETRDGSLAYINLISFTKNKATEGADNTNAKHTRGLVSTWETKITTAKSKSPVVDLTTVSDPIANAFVAWTGGFLSPGYDSGDEPVVNAVITYVNDPSADTDNKITYIEMKPEPHEGKVLRLKHETDLTIATAEQNASTKRLTDASITPVTDDGADLARYLLGIDIYDDPDDNPRKKLLQQHSRNPVLVPWDQMHQCRSLHFAAYTGTNSQPDPNTFSKALFKITEWDGKSLAAKLIYAAQELASSGSGVTPANAFNCKLQKYDKWTLMGEVKDGTHETQ